MRKAIKYKMLIAIRDVASYFGWYKVASWAIEHAIYRPL